MWSVVHLTAQSIVVKISRPSSNNPEKMVVLSSFYSWKKWGPESSCDLSKATLLVSGVVWIGTQVYQTSSSVLPLPMPPSILGYCLCENICFISVPLYLPPHPHSSSFCFILLTSLLHLLKCKLFYASVFGLFYCVYSLLGSANGSKYTSPQT